MYEKEKCGSFKVAVQLQMFHEWKCYLDIEDLQHFMLTTPKLIFIEPKVPDPRSSCELLWGQRGASWCPDVWSERPQWDLRCLLLHWEDDGYAAIGDQDYCVIYLSFFYCFCLNLTEPVFSDTGRVFYTAAAEKFTFSEAEASCANRGARLATTGQLYLAWQGGMDVCNAGWLGDRSVRYPINIRRPQCGGGLVGVRTVYLHTNQTGYPLPESRYDAFCYTGSPSFQLISTTLNEC